MCFMNDKLNLFSSEVLVFSECSEYFKDKNLYEDLQLP